MTSIHVLIPKTGEPVVIHDPEAVVVGRRVHWEIDCLNADVRRVGIVFEEKEPFFQERAEGPYRCEKYVDASKVVMIWGTAPPNPPCDEKRRQCKYTVYGLDAQGNPVIEKDPKILTTDP